MSTLFDPIRMAEDINVIRSERPLVHNITNHVVMNISANALLALGASPVMAHAQEEVAEMTRLSGALVLNIGTLSAPWVEAMEVALAAAREAGKPVVLDPVGAGATSYRTSTARRLLERTGITVIRGNASEILAVANAGGQTRGVDAVDNAESALGAITDLSAYYEVTVSVSGAIDHIIESDRHFQVKNGVETMTRITGMGCVASAVTGAFCAVNPDPLTAATHAMAALGVAGEVAAETSRGPGSLQVALIDALATLSPNEFADRARVEC